MTGERNYEHLNDALRRCGASWNAAQVHGLIAAQLAAVGPASAEDCFAQILDGGDPADALQKECKGLWQEGFTTTHKRRSERLSGFMLVLPDDSVSTADRTAALASWSEGFLHGLVSGRHLAGEQGTALKARLAAEPLADIIKDMLEITRASADTDADDEEEEVAYIEIVEYLRVASQLVYEELADLRSGPSK